MDETKTVSTDMDLYTDQYNYVQGMRSAVSAFSKSDPSGAKKAIQNITILRVYHQITRIIKYIELMDKLEDKMYESIDLSLDSMDTMDPATWVKLVSLQEKLQRNMIESHKLLEPYLNMDSLTSIEIKADDPNETFTAMILDQTSREKLRNSAQEVLAAITTKEEPSGE